MTMNEAKTRKELIDKQLAAAGWNVNDFTQVIKELDIEVKSVKEVREPSSPYDGHQFSDYALLGKDGKPLAVVEAKKTSKDAEIGREQAKQYCYNLQKERGGELPFCFYTNGLETYFWDLENYPPRKVYGYPTREDLEHLKYIRTNRKILATELINTKIAGRDYQIKAIRSVMEGIAKKQRKFLLVMATGTGKTRTCIAMVDALMRAGWVEKTLFLVDRIALRNQALEAFKEHLPDEPRWPKIGEKSIAADRRIYVSTYPTMLNIIRDDNNPLSPHFFDLIVVDESHRSIYNTYQEIIDYFDAISLGLTATPTDIIDHNTFNLFNCEDGLPSFAFSYDEAVDHIPPYLSDFQVMKIKTKFQAEGISKRTISLEDQKKLILEGKEVEEINYEGTEIEKRVINKGTNVLIVKEFMEESIKDPNGVLPGKSIFFCTSISHARRVEKIFDSLYPEYAGELAKVIVSDDPRVYGKGGLLDQFKNKDMPRVGISVGMLDTGIDIRELLNLVFAKPVFSYTRFWQMIGRGTRLLEENKIQPWCPEKDVFLIMDCWDNFEYFKVKPKGKEVKPQIPLPVRFVGVRIDKIECAIETDQTEIAEKEIQKLKNQIAELPSKSIVIQDAAKELEPLKDENFWKFLNSDKIEFLRTNIKPLFRTISQVDFKAMRFEKDVLETSLAFMNRGEDQDSDEYQKFDTLKTNVLELISELPLSVNVVAKEEELITKAQTNNYWATITDPMMDELAEKLAPLMKYRDSRPVTGPEKFDFLDELKEKDMVEFGPEHEALSVARYRELVEEKINSLTNENPILQKLKSGFDISETEAEILAEDLHNEQPYITEELLRKVYKNQKAKFIQFIKHILGIEILESFPDTVSKSIDKFIEEHTYLTTKQLEFLTLLRDYIIDKGDVHKRDLIQSPFTVLHPDGILGIFEPKEIDEIVSLTEKLVA
jgi:type I restriction enzyme R subunit